MLQGGGIKRRTERQKKRGREKREIDTQRNTSSLPSKACQASEQDGLRVTSHYDLSPNRAVKLSECTGMNRLNFISN